MESNIRKEANKLLKEMDRWVNPIYNRLSLFVEKREFKVVKTEEGYEHRNMQYPRLRIMAPQQSLEEFIVKWWSSKGDIIKLDGEVISPKKLIKLINNEFNAEVANQDMHATDE